MLFRSGYNMLEVWNLLSQEGKLLSQKKPVSDRSFLGLGEKKSHSNIESNDGVLWNSVYHIAREYKTKKLCNNM